MNNGRVSTPTREKAMAKRQAERKETHPMKKLLAILLVAVLALALVACGTEPETTTSSTAADTNTTPDTSSSAADTSSTEDPSGEVEPEDPPLFSEGIDILNGDYEYMAVEPFWYDGTWPCQFEDGHIQLDFNWALVFKMNETMEGVYEQLIHKSNGIVPRIDAVKCLFHNHRQVSMRVNVNIGIYD